jgi:glucose-1-phosphate thymidylyltransferase
MKGVLLAGGLGSRLYPLSISVSKQLLPVYNKPMIFYPLCTLLFAGIRDIRLVCSPRDEQAFASLLGDGSQFGVTISYGLQQEPRGIPESLTLSASFIDGGSVCLALGDNIFYGAGVGETLSEYNTDRGATVLAQQVSNPDRYGVVEFDALGRAISIEEKPEKPKSKFAIPGLYFYDGTACDRANSLIPSARGETEITDLNRSYLEDELLSVKKLPRGTAWLDTGTVASLSQASEFVKAIETRQGLLIGSPEEVAWRLGYIDDATLEMAARRYQSSDYGRYLGSLLD